MKRYKYIEGIGSKGIVKAIIYILKNQITIDKLKRKGYN